MFVDTLSLGPLVDEESINKWLDCMVLFNQSASSPVDNNSFCYVWLDWTGPRTSVQKGGGGGGGRGGGVDASLMLALSPQSGGYF